MKKFTASLILGFALLVSTNANAESTFRINAPTKADTILSAHHESIWAKEDKNPVADFFADLFKSKPAPEPVVEIKAAEIKQAEPQHIASVDLSNK